MKTEHVKFFEEQIQRHTDYVDTIMAFSEPTEDGGAFGEVNIQQMLDMLSKLLINSHTLSLAVSAILLELEEPE